MFETDRAYSSTVFLHRELYIFAERLERQRQLLQNPSDNFLLFSPSRRVTNHVLCDFVLRCPLHDSLPVSFYIVTDGQPLRF